MRGDYRALYLPWLKTLEFEELLAAVRLLLKLRDLARYQGTEEAFQQRLNSIRDRYSRRPGLLDRLRRSGL